MFKDIAQLPADPILGLGMAFNQDQNPDKINLTVGVYQDDSGNTPVFSAIKKAEQSLLEKQKSKSYIAQAGDPLFLDGMTRMILGDELYSDVADRVAKVMSVGGSGALRMCGELLADKLQAGSKLWVGDPTWANHFPILQGAGLVLEKFPYYDMQANQIDFEKMLAALKEIPEGDVILLHGCCHNPTGADLTETQWDQVLDIIKQRKITPFIDVAYLGFGQGLDEDAYSLRQAVKLCPEVLIAASCSKNFGVYRERAGLALVVTETAQQSVAVQSHLMANARRVYSMPPYHGAAVVGELLANDELTNEWRSELNLIRQRMHTMRKELASGLNRAQQTIDFSFIAQSNGMFCYLGIPAEHVVRLREEYSIYMLESTRINIAGLSLSNMPVVVKRVVEMINR
jgi:aspartate aminotransferase